MTIDKEVHISLPEHVVSIVNVRYLHGSGVSIRSMSLPSADAEDYFRLLDRADLLCDHALPVVWIFDGIWPTKGMSYNYVTPDAHAATRLLGDPRLIRQVGEPSPFIPLDPQTGDATMSVVEHNSWLRKMIGQSDEGDIKMEDFKALQNTDIGSVEDFLRQAASGETNNNEGDSK